MTVRERIEKQRPRTKAGAGVSLVPAAFVRAIFRTRLSGVLVLIALLALWQVYATYISRTISLPPIFTVLGHMHNAVSTEHMLDELGTTVERLAIGFLIATAIGILLGVFMGSVRAIYRMLEPLTELLRPIPVSALLPVAILFFGIGAQMKIVMVIYASLWPILLNTYTGVRNVDRTQLDTGRTFGLSSIKILAFIRMPAAAPYITTGMRISLATSLVVEVVAEMLAGDDGIGYYILNEQRTFHVPEMYDGIIVLAVLGYLLNLLFVVAEHRIVFWAGQT